MVSSASMKDTAHPSFKGAVSSRPGETSIQFVKGVGPTRKKLFANLGVETVEDLLYLFPRRYEDRRRMTPLAMVKPGETQSVMGKVLAAGGRRSWHTRKHLFEAVIDDGSGRITAVYFNQPYLQQYFKPGRTVVLYGRVEVYKNRLQMIAPEYEVMDPDDPDTLNTGRIVPVYPLTRGMTQRYLRRVMRACLEKYLPEIADVLPVSLRNRYRLANIRRSLAAIHFPDTFEDQREAHRRICWEEFFFFQLSVILRRQSLVRQPGFAHTIGLSFVRDFERAMPFPLTGAQKRVIREIAGDMQKPVPMLRLLQGDVGSGKTVPALFACAAAWKNNKQAALMAPTEILARQHAETVGGLLVESPLSDLRVACLFNSMKAAEKKVIAQRLENGEIDLLIGTHALLSETIRFRDLSLVVIDEQHKFGVRQRAVLSEKSSHGVCDVLVMTATPIPRTLSLTLYGDLDVSVLDELPPGRGTVVTRVVPLENDEEVYAEVRQRLQAGEQAYVIYPLVEESEKLDLKAAEEMVKTFQTKTFSSFRVGLIHGRMKRSQAEEVMEKFKNKEIQLLVATTVVEVGVDVPNANIMIIEHAERFGLAQLHQLRGRIGRGGKDAVCYLLADPVTEDARARLKVMASTRDGFRIAEEDLLIRGPGHYFGRHQHGLNELKYAHPAREMDLLTEARKEAEAWLHQDPDLSQKEGPILRQVIQQRYPAYLKMVTAG